jgi:hypothetical protein
MYSALGAGRQSRHANHGQAGHTGFHGHGAAIPCKSWSYRSQDAFQELRTFQGRLRNKVMAQAKSSNTWVEQDSEARIGPSFTAICADFAWRYGAIGQTWWFSTSRNG